MKGSLTGQLSFSKWTFLLLATIAQLFATAQKNDYIWLSGYGSQWGYDSSQNILYGTSIMDFNQTPIQVSYDSLKMNFSRTTASQCAPDGDLLFYTNGIYVANALGEILENGDSINDGPFLNWYDSSCLTWGYPVIQGGLILPHPSESGLYYIINAYIDTTAQPYLLYTPKLNSALVDMNYNSGNGKVLYKNAALVSGNLGSEPTACKHANGRDWWVIVQERATNCYNRVLITPSGIQHFLPNCEGSLVLQGAVGAACFSPDGSKYAFLAGYNAQHGSSGLNVFDFDRCSGELSNNLFIPIPELEDSALLACGLSFSPNNRFLYVGITTMVLQFDMEAVNITSSVEIVAAYDGFQAPFGSVFQAMQLGADGKIYESCGSTEWIYHVIERPDEKGDSCLFTQHGLLLPSPSAGVPLFPNYRLGPLTGSACDTLLGMNNAETTGGLNVFPNPVADVLTIDYGNIKWDRTSLSLEIRNCLGEVISSIQLPEYSALQHTDVSKYSEGVYQVNLTRSGRVLTTKRFVKIN